MNYLTMVNAQFPPHVGPEVPSQDDEESVVVLLVLSLLQERHRSWNEEEIRQLRSYSSGVVRSRNRTGLEDRMGSFTDTEFKCIFRMTSRAMEILIHRLFPFLRVNLPDAIIEGRSGGNRRPVSVDEKVCIGLLIMGGATLGPTIWGNHVGKTTVYSVFDQFVTAVVSSNVGPIHFPETDHEMEVASQSFLESGFLPPAFHGCLGPLDGYAVCMKMPGSHERNNGASYVNRKGFCLINCQAICDNEVRCIYLSTETPGGTHDSTAWECSHFGRRWTDGYYVSPTTGRVFWIASDEAYGASHNMCSPWPGTGLITREPFKDGFNYYLSGGIRNKIERLFGQVYARWGILWRPLRYSARKVLIILKAIFQLHNFLKEVHDGEPSSSSLGGIRAREKRRKEGQQSGFDDSPYEQGDVTDKEDATTAQLLPRIRTSTQCPI